MDIAVAAIHAGVDVPVAHGANPRWRVVEHHVHRLKEVPLVRRAVFGFADSRLDFTASARMPDNTPCARSTVVAPAPWAPMLAIHASMLSRSTLPSGPTDRGTARSNFRDGALLRRPLPATPRPTSRYRAH